MYAQLLQNPRVACDRAARSGSHCCPRPDSAGPPRGSQRPGSVLKRSQVKLSCERRVPERLGGLSAMLIGHGGRGAGRPHKDTLLPGVQAGLPGVAVGGPPLPLPRRPDCCCHCWRHPRWGRGHPDTSGGRAGGVPCVSVVRKREAVSVSLISRKPRAQPASALTATTPHLLAGGGKAVPPGGAAQQEAQTQAQRVAPRRQGRSPAASQHHAASESQSPGQGREAT